MKKIYYSKDKILWDGKNVYYSNGNYAWNGNSQIAFYLKHGTAVVYNMCYWKNGSLAWDGEKGIGYNNDGTYLTDFGVAIELSRKITLLCDKKYLTLQVDAGLYKNPIKIVLIKY